jgi:hypothetical protein
MRMRPLTMLTLTVSLVVLADQSAFPAKMDPNVGHFVGDADTNDDQSVDQYEHDQWLARIVWPAGDEAGRPGGIPSPDLTAARERYGANFAGGPGAATARDFYNQQAAAFAKADANSDGALNAAEAQTYVGFCGVDGADPCPR